MKTYSIKWSNHWLIEAETKEKALEEAQEYMHEASFDKDQFKIVED
jgi:hypothetical protein